MKICRRCTLELPLDRFHKHKETKDGLRTACITCRNLERKAWRDSNPEHTKKKNDQYNKAKVVSGYRKKYYGENKEKIREQSRESYRNVGLETQRAWQEENRGKVREYCQFRRALLKTATPEWADREEMRYIHQLAADRGLVVDHIVPLNSPYVCGLNIPANLRCITEALNLHKGNRYWPDMPK